MKLGLGLINLELKKDFKHFKNGGYLFYKSLTTISIVLVYQIINILTFLRFPYIHFFGIFLIIYKYFIKYCFLILDGLLFHIPESLYANYTNFMHFGEYRGYFYMLQQKKYFKLYSFIKFMKYHKFLEKFLIKYIIWYDYLVKPFKFIFYNLGFINVAEFKNKMLDYIMDISRIRADCYELYRIIHNKLDLGAFYKLVRFERRIKKLYRGLKYFFLIFLPFLGRRIKYYWRLLKYYGKHKKTYIIIIIKYPVVKYVYLCALYRRREYIKQVVKMFLNSYKVLCVLFLRTQFNYYIKGPFNYIIKILPYDITIILLTIIFKCNIVMTYLIEGINIIIDRILMCSVIIWISVKGIFSYIGSLLLRFMCGVYNKIKHIYNRMKLKKNK